MAYQSFASFYDILTRNVDYKKIADYLVSLFSFYNHSSGIVLDLACGTGNLTLELSKRGYDIYGVDSSEEMLSEAFQKAYQEEKNILFLCQKMEELDLYGTIDTCICCLDSINHITDKNTLMQAFEKVSLFMNKNGLFIFDCNTRYKHEKILADNVFVYDTRDVYCVWQNHFNKNEDITEIQLDFFEPNEKNNYKRNTEIFSEKIYEIDELTAMLTNAGFSLEGIFDDVSYDKPKENSQRLFFIAKKI